jgi:quercetin dioxygenase-like cupin family protein
MTGLSQAAEIAVCEIESKLRRRLLASGLLGFAALLSTKTALAGPYKPFANRQTGPDGITRTILEQHISPDSEDEFKMVLTEYPPGVGLPRHHHPSVALNYILEGVAESQYADEDAPSILTAGQSYQDKAGTPHLIFRNPDRSSVLKYLIVYTVKKGQPFLIVP